MTVMTIFGSFPLYLTVSSVLIPKEIDPKAEAEETWKHSHPMQPSHLVTDKTTRVGFSRMTLNESSHFHASDASKEVVLNFASHSKHFERISNLFTTCFKYATVTTKVFICDCGARSEAFRNY